MPDRIDERLRLRRIQLMLTQEELAERAGIDARTVRDIETGRTKSPRPSTVRLLTDALAAAEQDRAAAPNDTRATRPAVVRPRELPPDTFGFTGRSAQLAELDRLYTLSAHHPTAPAIVVLSGTAGVGKTALAVHWAHRSADRFPDGQLYLNLRGYDPDRPMPPTEALAALLRSLGMSGAEIPPTQDDRARLFRTLVADHRMLLLLDNALDVDQIRDLLPGAPSGFVLVTSRDSLAGLAVRHGGHTVDVTPLSQADAQALLQAHIGDRAVTAPAAADALADRCARLPLALRVAAQRTVTRPTVTLAVLVAELADERHRLDLLDSGEPHSSVRTVFSWSCRQLPVPMARLFRLLGALPSRDVDLYALAALAGVDLREARHLVSGLCRAHLVDEIADGRFAMHDLLRVYAKQQAEEQPDDLDAALTRLFGYYVNAAAHAMASFAPYERFRPTLPEQTAELPAIDSRESALAWLDAERANLVAAGLHAATNGWPTYTSQLSAILCRYLSIGAHWAEAALLHRAACDTSDADGTRPGLVNYGWVLFRSGRPQEALEHLHHAAQLLHESESRRDEARALGDLAVVYSRLGQQLEAIEFNNQALDIMRAIDDRYLEAIALENFGLIYQRLGKYPESFDFQHRALALYQEFEDPHGEAGVRGNLGVTCSQLGRHAEALEHHQRVLAILRVIGDRQHEAETLNDFGTTLRLAGSPRQAIERHQQALDRAVAIDDRYDQARAYEGTARAYTELGDLDNARAHWQMAFEIHSTLGTSQAEDISATLRDLASR
ncbi:ATP-binding protein [Actinophytocola sp.]|uniref:ATP-binding protein n=1 Tax=Actinophytocola sp. TaxID=1872138 RepID=UPI003899F481